MEHTNNSTATCTRLNKYKLIAYLADPNSEHQKQALGDSYEKVLKDFKAVDTYSEGSVDILLEYRIDSDVIETFDEITQYVTEYDGDGFCLYEKIEQAND